MLSKFIIICSVLALWETTSASRDRFVGNTPKSIIFGKFIQQSANTFPYTSLMFKLLNKPLSILSKEKIIHLTRVRLFLTGQIPD